MIRETIGKNLFCFFYIDIQYIFDIFIYEDVTKGMLPLVPMNFR